MKRAAKVVSIVVAAQFGLACVVLIGDVVVGIECIIAAGVEEAAVKFVRTRLGRKADDGARCLTILCAVGVADHFEFSDGVDCRIDENSAVRSDVIVVDAVDQEQIVGVGVCR